MTPYSPYVPSAVLTKPPLHLDRLWGVVALLLVVAYAY